MQNARSASCLALMARSGGRRGSKSVGKLVKALQMQEKDTQHSGYSDETRSTEGSVLYRRADCSNKQTVSHRGKIISAAIYLVVAPGQALGNILLRITGKVSNTKTIFNSGYRYHSRFNPRKYIRRHTYTIHIHSTLTVMVRYLSR